MADLVNSDKAECCEFKQCLRILHLMLDDEASPAEEEYLVAHIDKCIFCFEQYEVEFHIRELLKTKLAHKPVPPDLSDAIKSKISRAK